MCGLPGGWGPRPDLGGKVRLPNFFLSLETSGHVTSCRRRDLFAISFCGQIGWLCLFLHQANMQQFRRAYRRAVPLRVVNGIAAVRAMQGREGVVEEEKC